ncbi:MAG: 4Fe-4S dicluster domain-containing protein, partial [Chlorobi bacterium]|nr:4Fe-4S dicluster domain-containing protein [Chlorobiota bacterium]
TTEESARQYLKAQDISIEVACRIRSMGYSARAQVSGSNYQLMLPPLAYDAGLGEIGRNGYLISEKFGPRVRLGCITTELKLKTDKPKSFGATEFCEICKKCSVNCPSGSISKDRKQTVRGVEKWQLGIEKCYQYWRIIGTDCGLCMKVCPFSHPSNFIHNIFRFGIKNSVIARHLSIIGDDLFYGRKFKYKKMDK